MKTIKKYFSVFLIVVFTMSLLPATALAANTISASKIVSTAKGLVGQYPYVYGGESVKEGGFDCSGLVYYVYHTCLGADMTLSQAGRGKAALAESGTKITNKKDFLPGDIVQFTYPHVAIYIGNDTIVEAAKPGTKVRMRSIKTDNNISYAVRLSYVTQKDLTEETINNEIISEGIYTLTPKNAPKMRLDISGASTSDGANVQIYTANNTDAQKFKFKYVGNGYYSIQSVASGKVLDVKSKSNTSGANVQQWSAVSGASNQSWMLKNAGSDYYYIIPGTNSNLCLDVASAGTSNCTNVQVYTSNQTDAQKWKLTKTKETSEGDDDEPITPPKAKIIVDTTAVLKNGSTGTQVKYLQMNLNAINYSCGTVDGTYGTNTKNAVLQFQKAEGLKQDGIAGPATLKRMAEIATQTQIDLYKLGYYKGNIDGVMGSSTRTAIKNFQKEYNYYQSSLATLAVRNALTKAVNEK